MSRIGKKPVPSRQASPPRSRARRSRPRAPRASCRFIGPTTSGRDGERRRAVDAARREQAARAPVGHVAHAWSHNMFDGVTKGFERKLEINGVGYRAAVQGKDLQAVARLSATTSTIRSRQGSRSRRRSRPKSSITGIDKQQVGQVAAEIRDYPPARALQGQGREVRGRVHLPQGRQEEVRSRQHGQRKHKLRERRKARVRRALKAVGERPSAPLRLPLVEAHLCADHRRCAGRTLAAASSLEKDLRDKLKTGADKDAARRRQAPRGARASKAASRTSSSIAAATSITAGSRRWRMPPAKAA